METQAEFSRASNQDWLDVQPEAEIVKNEDLLEMEG